MMPSNQFMFLEQVGVPNSHQQQGHNSIQQAFMQYDSPLQPHLLRQSLTKPIQSSPSQQPVQQYSTHSPTTVQSIMAPPCQSGLSSQFFTQVSQPQQHLSAFQHQLNFNQLNNINNGHNRLPMQNGHHRPIQKNSMNQDILTSLLLSSRKNSVPEEFRSNVPVSTASSSTFIPEEFRQLSQLLRQPPTTVSSNVVLDQYRPPVHEFRSLPKHNQPSMSELRQLPKQPTHGPGYVVPDEFRQAPIQTFGEQLDQANVVVSGLIENIEEMIESTDDPKLNSSNDLNGKDGNALNDSVIEIRNDKDSGDIDNLVDELLKDVEEMDSSFTANDNKDKSIEIDDSFVADDKSIEVDGSFDEQINEGSESEKGVRNVSDTTVLRSILDPGLKVDNEQVSSNLTNQQTVKAAPDDQTENNLSDTLNGACPLNTSSPKPVIGVGPSCENIQSALESSELLELKPNILTFESLDPNIKEDVLNGEVDIKPSFTLRIRTDVFFKDAVDLKNQKNVIGMENNEREALVAALNLPKETVTPNMVAPPTPDRSLLEETLKFNAENRIPSFGNDQLDEIFRTQLSAPPQFGRQFGLQNLSLPSNMPPILGSILTQHQTNGRQQNITPVSQLQQPTQNPFSVTNPNIYFNFLNPIPATIENRPPPPKLTFHQPCFQEKPKVNFGETTAARKRPAGRYSGNADEREPLHVDPTLPPGWSRSVNQRKNGASAGSWDTYIHAPNGKRFRSRMEIKRHFEKTGETNYNWEDFDFNPFGSKGQANPESTHKTGNLVEGDEISGVGPAGHSLLTQNAQLLSDPGAEMLQMEPDIHDYLSCELGNN